MTDNLLQVQDLDVRFRVERKGEPFRAVKGISFDIGRNPNPHYGFGAPGPHFCLGAHLARRELEVAFRKMFEQMPDLEVVGEPDRLQSSFVNGIKRLPVRLTGQGR